MVRLIVLFALLFFNGCNHNENKPGKYPDFPAVKDGYPHLAMWWPDTFEQTLDELKRYDWIGFGEWDNIQTIEDLKSVNPEQKHFMDYSITETSWDDWGNRSVVLEIMEKYPRNGS